MELNNCKTYDLENLKFILFFIENVVQLRERQNLTKTVQKSYQLLILIK